KQQDDASKAKEASQVDGDYFFQEQSEIGHASKENENGDRDDEDGDDDDGDGDDDNDKTITTDDRTKEENNVNVRSTPAGPGYLKLFLTSGAKLTLPEFCYFLTTNVDYKD
ncbi:hypothetical protein HAX54_021803, partial [Datura stramonium]|nr:hypothetical protein [Datura stramonium]